MPMVISWLLCYNYYSGSLHIADRVSASAIMDDIQKSIENWEEKDINKQCYDFVLGKLLTCCEMISRCSYIEWFKSLKIKNCFHFSLNWRCRKWLLSVQDGCCNASLTWSKKQKSHGCSNVPIVKILRYGQHDHLRWASKFWPIYRYEGLLDHSCGLGNSNMHICRTLYA